MKVYQLKVTIPGLKGTYRIIEATGNCTFDDLHDAIFSAFDRFDEHLYSFYITREDTKNMRKIYDSREITHPSNTKDPFGYSNVKKESTAKTHLDDIHLAEKDVFYYLFDFGDEWWHRISVESISEASGKKKSIKIAKIVGESPPQYPDYDENYDDEDD